MSCRTHRSREYVSQFQSVALFCVAHFTIQRTIVHTIRVSRRRRSRDVPQHLRDARQVWYVPVAG